MSKKEVRDMQKKVAEQIKDQFNTNNEKGEEEMAAVTTEEMEKVREIVIEAIENNEEVSQAAKDMLLKELKEEAKESKVKGFFKKVFTKKNAVRLIGATAVVAVIGGVVYMVKNRKFEDDSVLVDATDDMVTITEV